MLELSPDNQSTIKDLSILSTRIQEVTMFLLNGRAKQVTPKYRTLEKLSMQYFDEIYAIVGTT